MPVFKKQIKKMGSAFELIVIQNTQQNADFFFELAENELDRLENKLSEFIPNSIISQINNLSNNQKISLDIETANLLKRALNISKVSNGAFDISVKPLKNLYNFKNENFDFPDNSTINMALNCVGYQFIQIDENNIFSFLKENMSISLAAIGKGFAADCVKFVWSESGLQNGVISASGDIAVLGANEHNKPWTIGIANPDKPDETLLFVPIDYGAMATSGNYIQYFERFGERFGHNISPFNGLPCPYIKSISVFSPSAELSDAIATAVYVMGLKNGILFIEQLPQTHCIIIDDKNKIHFSKNINLNEIKD